ncbi:MAG: hypothetical protein Q9212_005254 [Teloschistes hypoglaucus]
MTTSNPLPPADIDAMLHDVSNQMARSQLFRRLSANSKSSSPGSRRGNARVAKPASNGSTPLGVQRRRTTAAHTSRNPPTPTPISKGTQNLHPRIPAIAPRAIYNGAASAARPVTWHPGSYAPDHYPQELQYGNPLELHSSIPYSNPWSIDFFNHTSHASFDQTIPSESPYLDATAQSTMSENLSAYDDLSSFYSSSYNDATHFTQQTAEAYDPTQVYSGFENFDLYQMPYAHTSYSTQQTFNALTAQYPLHVPQYVQTPTVTPLTKQRSKELVGMGLYDGPGRRELSSLNSSPDHISHLLTEPQGKGLKLEETWQPPDEDGDEGEEDGYSTDEAEDDLPSVPAANEGPPTLVPTYGDLSNQSFFFDGDDAYPNYLSVDPSFQFYQPKVSDPSAQNFMWL